MMKMLETSILMKQSALIIGLPIIYALKRVRKPYIIVNQNKENNDQK